MKCRKFRESVGDMTNEECCGILNDLIMVVNIFTHTTSGLSRHLVRLFLLCRSSGSDFDPEGGRLRTRQGLP